MSGLLDPRFLDELRAAVRCSDVVGRKLRLKREGSEYVVVGDPSFHVSDKKQRWFDNGSANIDGDVFEFLVRFEGMSFPDAVAEIARMAGIRLPGEIREPARHDAGNGEKKQPAPSRGPKRVIAATYDYTDGNGFLQYQVVRYEPKDFRQRRPQRADDDRRKVDADGFVESRRRRAYFVPPAGAAARHARAAGRAKNMADNGRRKGLPHSAGLGHGGDYERRRCIHRGHGRALSRCPRRSDPRRQR